MNDAPTVADLSAGETVTDDTARDRSTSLRQRSPTRANVTGDTLTLIELRPPARLMGRTSGSVTSTYTAGTGVWQRRRGAIVDVNTLRAGVIFDPGLELQRDLHHRHQRQRRHRTGVTGSKAMTGAAVNDAPANAVRRRPPWDEDTDLVFTVGRTIGVVATSDVDPGHERVTLSATNGTVTLSGIVDPDASRSATARATPSRRPTAS